METSTSDHHSGTQGKKKKGKKKSQNGKTNWKALAQKQSEELKDLKTEFCHLQEEYTKDEDLTRVNKCLKGELKALQKNGFGEREQTRLRVLQHFYSRVANIQVCAKDKKKFEALVADVQDNLKGVNK